jgi:D-2-hydroxyacid dehydrogenase (NADP+)
MNRPSAAETKLVICVWHPFDLWRPPPSMAQAVRQRWPEMRVVHLLNYDRLEAEIPDTQIFVGYSIRPHQLPFARQLKWIHSTAAGVAQLTYPTLRESGILVTNASGVHSIPIAEHVIGMLLSLSRKFPDALRHQENHKWAQQEIWDAKPRPSELHSATLLLIGLGAIGKEIAKRAKALGMKIEAVTRSGRGDATLAEKIYPATELEAALAQADYIVVAAPETPATNNLLGPRQFAAMKPTAFVVNVARGSLIDESALTAALQQKKIAGAALDVAAEEPLPPESPLWRQKNIMITPHLAAASENLWPRQTDLLLRNLDLWFAGKDLINKVDFERGY